MDMFSKHSAFCKVSIMCHLIRNVLKFLKDLPNRLTWLEHILTTGPNPLCTYSAQISHVFVAQPMVHMRFFNFSLNLTMAYGTLNTHQFTKPSSHHTTSHNGYIHPEPSLASYCKCMLLC